MVELYPKTETEAMKKVFESIRDNRKLRGIVLIAVVCAAALIIVLCIENGNSESIGVLSEKVEQKENAEKNTILIKDNVSLEVLSCEMIEDFDIENQTTYAAEWFKTGEMPDADYQEEFIDTEKIKEVCPELKEIWETDRHTLEEEGEIYNRNLDVIKQYTTMRHPKTRYYFAKCRITNLSKQTNNVSLSYYTFVCSGKSEYQYLGGSDTTHVYFDKAVNTTGEDRLNRFFWYPLEGGEVLECTMGFEIKQEWDDNEKYYIGVSLPGVNLYTFENTKVIPLTAEGDENE